jgi:transposase
LCLTTLSTTTRTEIVSFFFHCRHIILAPVSSVSKLWSTPPPSTTRKGRKQLSIEKRSEIVGAYKLGHKPADIARTLGFPPPTVYTIVRHYRKSGSAQPKQRHGRPKLLSDRDQRALDRIVRKDRFQTLGEITTKVNVRLNKSLCQDTVRKYMAEAGYHSCKVCKKPLVSKKTSRRG